jgi:hypothetical protein
MIRGRVSAGAVDATLLVLAQGSTPKFQVIASNMQLLRLKIGK